MKALKSEVLWGFAHILAICGLIRLNRQTICDVNMYIYNNLFPILTRKNPFQQKHGRRDIVKLTLLLQNI